MSLNVLVTGITGFLGSHIALTHLSRGDSVVGIDNFSSSKRKSSHVLRMVQDKSGCLIYDGDINDEKKLQDVFECAKGASDKIDVVYNFACPASPPTYQKYPVDTLLTCTAGVNNVLNFARKFGAKVVHASTSEVYGEPLKAIQSEKDRSHVNSYGPRSCYDSGKMAAEALCYDYLHKYDLDVRLVRIFNTYGPHMDPFDGRVVSNFIRQAILKEDLTLYGDGMQTRSFCYVSDLVKGIIRLGELNTNPQQPINLGNPSEFTMLELANLVLKLAGDKSLKFEFKPLPVDDPTHRCPDISLATKLLDWTPKVTLEDGISKTMSHFLLNLDSLKS